MSELGAQLVKEVTKFVDAKVHYQHRGTSMFGCDCTGMIIGALRNLGYLKKYKLRKYKYDWNLHSKADNHIEEELMKFAKRVPNSLIEPGDILLFRFGKCKAHVGVFIKDVIMAHCWKDGGKCCYTLLKDSPLSLRWVCSYRLDKDRLLKAS